MEAGVRNWTYLDKQRTGYESDVGNESQNTGTPEEPENAVIDSHGKTRFLLARLFSPFLLALLPLASDGPPDAL